MVHNIYWVGSISNDAASLDITLDIRAGKGCVFLYLACIGGGLWFCGHLAVRRFVFGLFVLLISSERTRGCAQGDREGQHHWSLFHRRLCVRLNHPPFSPLFKPRFGLKAVRAESLRIRP